MSATEPSFEPKPEAKRFIVSHPLMKLCAFKVPVVIQQKGGNVIKGRAKWFRKGYLKLTDAEVIGSNRQTKTDWILVDHQSIAHIHPDSDAQKPEQAVLPTSGGQ